MALEDHAGDVVSKARQGLGISLGRAAEAAGIPPEAYGRFEEEGAPIPGLSYRGLGELLGLNGESLARVAEGWEPPEAERGRWRELRMITTNMGMAVNCFLLWDEASKEAALFDTGWKADPVFHAIEEHGLDLKHLFITHSHHDHVAALEDIRARFPKVKLHSSSSHAPPGQRNRADEFIALGNLRVNHRPTPGHAADGVTYIVGNWPGDAPSVAMVGDALFAGSMGGARDEFELAKRKVREEILSLPPETLICPGHGPLTTVGQERANNPFFAG